MTSEDQLKEAAALLRQGQLPEARTRLAALLQRDPHEERAWLLMSRAVEEPARQVECLRRALAINPGNEEAARRLESISPRPREVAGASPAAPTHQTAVDPPVPGSSPAPLPEDEPALPSPGEPGSQPAASGSLDDLRQAADWGAEGAGRPGPGGFKSSPGKTGPSRIYSEPSQKMTFWLAAGLAGFMLLLVLAGGVFGVQQVVSGRRSATAASLHATATYQARFILPPTWTPQVSVTAQAATPTLTPTRTATPPFLAPGPAAGHQMDEIREQVSGLRGLPILEDVPVYLLSGDRAGAVLYDTVEAAGLLEALPGRSQVLAALGLVPPHYDLTTFVLNRMAESFGGIYLPWQKQILLVGEAFSSRERAIFAHEFGHALVDQHYGIDRMDIYPDCLGDLQRCQSLRALVEGDAMLVMREWQAGYAGPGGASLAGGEAVPLLPDPSAPPALLEELNFPYHYGLEFVRVLHKRGGWAAVDQAYAEPPASTEQILHPEKYLDREAPQTVRSAPLAEALGSGWRRLESGVLGEWGTYLVLAHGSETSARLAEAAARQAASGWGGDFYQVYAHEQTGRVLLTVHWVWDTPGAAQRFRSAVVEHLSARFREMRLEGEGDCWETLQQSSCVFFEGLEALWLLAPDRTARELALQAYPSFR